MAFSGDEPNHMTTSYPVFNVLNGETAHSPHASCAGMAGLPVTGPEATHVRNTDQPATCKRVETQLGQNNNQQSFNSF